MMELFVKISSQLNAVLKRLHTDVSQSTKYISAILKVQKHISNFVFTKRLSTSTYMLILKIKAVVANF